MIGLAELTKLLETSEASPDEIPEQLAAWDINADEWKKWGMAITETTIENEDFDEKPVFYMFLQFWMGFELGYRLAVETELNRMANGQ